MALIPIQKAGLPQPALALALSPWTDISLRGRSQFGNDRYDLVQGYQTLQCGRWLKGGQDYSDAELSPMRQDFSNAAPAYIQAGGKEILVDMIRDFAHQMAQQGGQVRLDVWEHINHEFHADGSTLKESRQALCRLREAIYWVKYGSQFPPGPMTEVDTFAAK